MRIALLADRLRVEERLLTEAFNARGHEAILVAPSRAHLSLTDFVPAESGSTLGGQWPEPHLPTLALDRGPATPERTLFSALLAGQGTIMINRTATARLLADRLARVRHLALSQIPYPETFVSFGEEATFAAIEQLGYPVLLKPILSDLVMPVALVEDRDAAEAVVEHRTMLGSETAVLVQRFVRGSVSVRVAIVGNRVAGIETRHHSGWRPGRESSYAPYVGDTSALEAMAKQVVDRFGTGVYSVEVIETDNGPVVVGAENLVDFRTLHEREIDVAGMIADYALSQLDERNGGEPRG